MILLSAASTISISSLITVLIVLVIVGLVLWPGTVAPKVLWNCIGEDKMDSDNGIEITELPHGRIIKPTGSIFRLSEKTISQMSDTELKAHIISVKEKLAARRQEVDALAIQLSQAHHEVAERDERTRIHLRNVKVPKRAKIAATATTEDAFKLFTKKLAAEGLSPKEIADILNKLARS